MTGLPGIRVDDEQVWGDSAAPLYEVPAQPLDANHGMLIGERLLDSRRHLTVRTCAHTTPAMHSYAVLKGHDKASMREEDGSRRRGAESTFNQAAATVRWLWGPDQIAAAS
jgi:hypothetical protein